MSHYDNESPIIQRLKRASLEILVLKMLSLKDMYGYQLSIEIEKNTDGLCVYIEASLYKTLNRLLEQGLISVYNVISTRNQTRVYYHLEQKGREYFEEMKNDYLSFSEKIGKFLLMEDNFDGNKDDDGSHSGRNQCIS